MLQMIVILKGDDIKLKPCLILIKVNKKLQKPHLKHSKQFQILWENGRLSWLRYVHMLVCSSYTVMMCRRIQHRTV